MDFCPECGNMLDFRVTEGELLHHCPVCEYTAKTTQTVISRTVHTEGAYEDTSRMRYLRFSEAVPRTIHKECPNRECPSRKGEAPQESVIVNKENSMEQVLICTACNTLY